MSRFVFSQPKVDVNKKARDGYVAGFYVSHALC